MRKRDEPLDKNVSFGRIRVEIHGLDPLEMMLPILLPLGETTTVELEYENLEKHCFSCLSLFHEKKQCRVGNSPSKDHNQHFRISQQNTLSQIKEDKKCQYWRRNNRAEPCNHRD